MDYISENDEQAAVRFMNQLLDKIDWIAEAGFAGVPRNGIRPDLRAHSFRNHSIYYSIDEKSVRILRVLHMRRDITKVSFEDD